MYIHLSTIQLFSRSDTSTKHFVYLRGSISLHVASGSPWDSREQAFLWLPRGQPCDPLTTLPCGTGPSRVPVPCPLCLSLVSTNIMLRYVSRMTMDDSELFQKLYLELVSVCMCIWVQAPTNVKNRPLIPRAGNTGCCKGSHSRAGNLTQVICEGSSLS